MVDQKGATVPLGSVGELCIRGYTVMKGYWDDEENTAKTITEDGWLKTGDQFILRPDGYGHIIGRLKDMVIRGGENIFPKVSTGTVTGCNIWPLLIPYESRFP